MSSENNEGQKPERFANLGEYVRWLRQSGQLLYRPGAFLPQPGADFLLEGSAEGYPVELRRGIEATVYMNRGPNRLRYGRFKVVLVGAVPVNYNDGKSVRVGHSQGICTFTVVMEAKRGRTSAFVNQESLR